MGNIKAGAFASTRCAKPHRAMHSEKIAKCGSNPNRDGLFEDYYTLCGLASSIPPATISALQAWLARPDESACWRGKLYVASTLTWHEPPDEFRQSGCSPNYQAQRWSLACCKCDMRRAESFRRQIIEKKVPTFVFTVAKKHAKGFQALVSVARVTNCFENMEEYARFLLDTGDEALISSRLTRTRCENGLLGSRFGDCHADRIGRVGRPIRDHVHGAVDEWWQGDIDGTHLILYSDDFLLWEKPSFITAETINQSRYGLDVTPQNLFRILMAR